LNEQASSGLLEQRLFVDCKTRRLLVARLLDWVLADPDLVSRHDPWTATALELLGALLALGVRILTLQWDLVTVSIKQHFLLVLRVLSVNLCETAILLILKRLRILQLRLLKSMTWHIINRGSALV